MVVEPAPRQQLVAYVLPFASFMILTALESLEPLKTYYPFVYSFKALAVFALWLTYRRHFPAWSSRGIGLGVAVGVAGVVVWIGLAQLALEQHAARLLPAWLAPGQRTGFDPLTQLVNPTGRMLFLAMRFFGLAIVVPLMEEVFWRGFLSRYLITENFAAAPIGQWTPRSFAIVTAAFAAVHPELLAAAVWCAGVNGLLLATRNLWACIAAHCVSNLLLGVYVVATGTWWLW